MHALKTFIYLLPLYVRFMQNMRQQYDSVQRKKEAVHATIKIRATEVEEEEEGVESGSGSEDNGDSCLNEDDVLAISARVLTNDEERCSPRGNKGSGGGSGSGSGNGREGGSGKPGSLTLTHTSGGGSGGGGGGGGVLSPSRRSISHSESMESSASASSSSRSAASYKVVAPQKGQYTYPARIKRFIFANLLIWPYSYNAFKYFLSMLVVIFGAYPPQHPDTLSYQVCYLTLAVVSTLYSTYWDFRNDWGLFQMKAPKPLLRDKIYYGNTEYFYYIVLVLNPIFR